MSELNETTHQYMASELTRARKSRLVLREKVLDMLNNAMSGKKLEEEFPSFETFNNILEEEEKYSKMYFEHLTTNEKELIHNNKIPEMELNVIEEDFVPFGGEIPDMADFVDILENPENYDAKKHNNEVDSRYATSFKRIADALPSVDSWVLEAKRTRPEYTNLQNELIRELDGEERIDITDMEREEIMETVSSPSDNRRIFYLDIGDMTPEEAKARIEKIMGIVSKKETLFQKILNFIGFIN